MAKRKKANIYFNIHVHNNGKPRKISVEGVPTNSPFFALHRAYYGDGNWGKSGWKLSHIPSGFSVGGEVFGAKAVKTLRVIACVLAAQPLDWASAAINDKACRKLPQDIQTWARRAVASYA